VTLVDDVLAYGITGFFGVIISSVFLQDVFSTLGAGKTLIFALSIGLLAYTGVIL
jgi:hypothetical protein